VIFLITNKQPAYQNIGKDIKIMHLGVLEPEIWSSVIFSQYMYMGGHIENGSGTVGSYFSDSVGSLESSKFGPRDRGAREE